MVRRIRVTININMNSKLAGTTMSKISFKGGVALRRAGLVLTFRSVYSARIFCAAMLISFQGPLVFITGNKKRNLQQFYHFCLSIGCSSVNEQRHQADTELHL